jgi:hypothetical protein
LLWPLPTPLGRLGNSLPLSDVRPALPLLRSLVCAEINAQPTPQKSNPNPHRPKSTSLPFAPISSTRPSRTRLSPFWPSSSTTRARLVRLRLRRPHAVPPTRADRIASQKGSGSRNRCPQHRPSAATTTRHCSPPSRCCSLSLRRIGAPSSFLSSAQRPGDLPLTRPPRP